MMKTKTFEEACELGNIATVTEPKRDCQEISIGLKKRKMEFLTFEIYSTGFGAV